MKFLSILLFVSVALSSCAPKLNKTQKANLNAVSVISTKVNPDSYMEPQGGNEKAAGVTTMVGAVAGGAVGGLLFGGIAQSVYAGQNAKYKEGRVSVFNSIMANTPSDVGGMVQQVFKDRVAQNSFFASRLKSSAPNQFQATLVKYGLIRKGKAANGEFLFAPRIVLQGKLMLADGKEMKLFPMQFQAESLQSTTLAMYASDRSRLRSAYQSAVQQLSVQINKGLKTLANE